MNKVRPIEKTDYQALARFLKKITGVETSFWIDRFSCWWDENPSMSDDVERGWILYEDDGEVGGTFGNIPVRYYIEGQERIVCSASNWYMSRKSRRRALEIFYPFLSQENPVINTTPAEKVVEISLQMGFKELNQSWLKEEAIYINDASLFWDYTARSFSRHQFKFYLIKSAGVVVIPLLKVFQALSRKRLTPLDKGYTFKEITTFDQRYDALSNKLKEKYAITAVRDSRALNWFFFGSYLLRSNRKVVEINNDGALIGYVGVKEGKKRQGEKTYNYIEVVDMVLVEESKPAYRTVLQALVEQGRDKEKNIVFIKTHIFNLDLKAFLKRSGFFSRVARESYLYRNFGDLDLDKNLYASPLDGDRCFSP